MTQTFIVMAYLFCSGGNDNPWICHKSDDATNIYINMLDIANMQEMSFRYAGIGKIEKLPTNPGCLIKLKNGKTLFRPKGCTDLKEIRPLQ